MATLQKRKKQIVVIQTLSRSSELKDDPEESRENEEKMSTPKNGLTCSSAHPRERERIVW